MHQIHCFQNFASVFYTIRLYAAAQIYRIRADHADCLFKIVRTETSCQEKWSGYLRDQGPVKGFTGSSASLVQQDVICRAL